MIHICIYIYIHDHDHFYSQKKNTFKSCFREFLRNFKSYLAKCIHIYIYTIAITIPVPI